MRQNYRLSPLIINTALCVALRNEYKRFLDKADGVTAVKIKSLLDMVKRNMNESIEFFKTEWEKLQSKSSLSNADHVQALLVKLKKYSTDNSTISSREQKKIKSSLTTLLQEKFTVAGIQETLANIGWKPLFEYTIKHNNATQCFMDHIIAAPSKHELFLKALQDVNPSTKQHYIECFFSTDLLNQSPMVKAGLKEWFTFFKRIIRECYNNWR